MKKAYYITQNIFVTLAIAIVLFLLAARFLPKFHYGLYIIQSGSMQPTLKTGSIVVDKKQADYQKGEIITFARSKKEIITHRITEVTGEGENILYKTKGDANNTDDLFLARKNLVLGKVIFAVPYFGYIIAFVKTKTGLVLLIIIPALWFIVEEALKVKKTIREKKNKTKGNEQEE
ncbi:MAG: signal peptidase I [Parcubacteria group bacterium]|jgi:signal peptidase